MNELYLAHHGVLGQKWGVRRFQNANGSLTAEGKKRYGADSIRGNVGRSLFGQHVSVLTNRGYRKDVKEIKSDRKDIANKIKKSATDSADKKAQLKNLKNDYKKTKIESRVTAAKVLYPWQSDSTNERIQSQSLGKAAVKYALAGRAGSLTYDRIKNRTNSTGKAIVAALLAGSVDYATAGLLGFGDYVVGSSYDKDRKG